MRPVDRTVKVALIDENDWYRELMGQVLLSRGIKLAGSARRPEYLSDVLAEAEVVLHTVSLEDIRCRELIRVLSGLPRTSVPAVVLQSDTFGSGAYAGGSMQARVGKADPVSTVIRSIRETARERESLLAAMSGEMAPELASDELLKALRLNADLTGCVYLRQAVPLSRGGKTPAKEIYVDVARRFRTAPENVERDIRSAVSRRLSESPVWVRMMIFGRDWDRKKTNLMLISRLGSFLERREEMELF